MDEATRVWKRKEFQDIYLRAVNQVRADLANTPGRNKATAVGMLLQSIEQLFKAGEYKEVITGIDKLAKLEGWVGADSNVNIFAGLTARDIAEQKERILREIDSSRNPESAGDNPATGRGMDLNKVPSGNA